MQERKKIDNLYLYYVYILINIVNMCLQDTLINLAEDSNNNHRYASLIIHRNKIIGTGSNYSTAHKFKNLQCILCG